MQRTVCCFLASALGIFACLNSNSTYISGVIQSPKLQDFQIKCKFCFLRQALDTKNQTFTMAFFHPNFRIVDSFRDYWFKKLQSYSITLMKVSITD